MSLCCDGANGQLALHQLAENTEKHVLQPIWRTPINGVEQVPQGRPAVSRTHLFIALGGIASYSRKDGHQEWLVPVSKYLPQALLYKNGSVFVVEQNISALDEKHGRKLWEFSPDGNASLGRAAIHGNTLCVGTDKHRIYALDTRTGRELWSADVGPDWKFPAVVRGIAMDGGAVYAAVEQWRTENGISSSGWLVAFSLRSGKMLWRYHTGDDDQRRGFSSSPVVAGDLVLAGDYFGNALVAVRRRTGQEVWRFEGEHSFAGFPEEPLVAHGSVYAASGDKYVYALYLPTGRLRWRFLMPASNKAYTLCGKSLVVNYQGLSVLDRETGKVQQSLLQRDADFPTSDFVTAGKTLYLAGPSAVYSFSCK